MDNHPIMIVMTPVRNEAWVLRFFLTATSRWADYIIIADQMSTDGSREIAAEFPKVILIDNKSPEFNEAERQAMLVAKAREVAAGRDTILWGLDADEVFDAHFRETNDWETILFSRPGDVFWFKWAEICPDKNHYWLSPTTYYPWAFHDDGKEPHGNYVRNMHSMRIPYPKEEKQMHYVDDFRVLHFAYVNPYRVAAKKRFYSFVDWEMNRRSPISLSRSYTQTKAKDQQLLLPDSYCYSSEKDSISQWELVDCCVIKCWMDVYIVERLNRHPMDELKRLDIWDSFFCESFGLADPRTWKDKIIHKYLHATQTNNSIIVRALDKFLKLVYR